MFEKWKEKQKLRKEKINQAREGFVSWLEISKSVGWKVYEDRVIKKIENIKNMMENKTDLTGDDLKKLQLALAVWREVQRIPRDLEDLAKGGK